jgi:hypothetical protein
MTALTQPPASATTPGQLAGARTSLVRSRHVQFDLPPRFMERLNTLKRNTEATSCAEVVKNALCLFEALIEVTEAGKQFMVRDAAGVVSPHRLFL